MDILLNKLKNLPSSPGIYQYYDKNGKLLYVGKAKNLKNRIKSYFKMTPNVGPSNNLSARITKMITETVDLKTIEVMTENEAFILEDSLIKQLKPKYNVLLRDDKTYPYIYVDYNKDFPRPEITRKIIKGKNIKYYGPFSSGARDIIDSIYEIFPLVQKSSCVKGKKLCLFYQIKKCLGPCEDKVTKQDYKKILDQAVNYLYNKEKIVKHLTKKQDKYSEELNFEEALKIRDKIKRIKTTSIKNTMVFSSKENIDVFKIKTQNQKTFVVKMFIREGKLISSTSETMSVIENENIEQEAYKRAIIAHYKQKQAITPDEILINIELEDKEQVSFFLEEVFGRKVKITNPQKGMKKQLIDIIEKNAKTIVELEEQKTDVKQEVQKVFALTNYPNRIETFDNSHMMGEGTVGAMVVYDNDKFIKADYRRYNLESKDEYAQMRETLSRRIDSFYKNSPPDLWVLDGGTTLLKLAKSLLDETAINIDLLAISKEKQDKRTKRAKGKAKDIVCTLEGEIKLEQTDRRLHFIQLLRDEAHKEAINFHKKQKQKKDQKISLIDVKGIGPGKVKKLVSYFGSFEKISTATIEELQQILSQKDAKNLIDFFKSKN